MSERLALDIEALLQDRERLPLYALAPPQDRQVLAGDAARGVDVGGGASALGQP